jgi:putative phosphoesterase
MSDVHSNLDALQAVIANLPDYDALVFLGDLVGYGPHPNEVVEQLQQLCPTAVLMGNHDHAVVTGDVEGFTRNAAEAVAWTRKHINPQSLAYLSSLRPSTRIGLNNNRLALFHGSPRDPLSEYVFPDITDSFAGELIRDSGVPLVLLGHTHMPMIFAFNKELLANPGSVGQPRDGNPRAAYAILTLMEDKVSFEIKRVEYNVDEVANEIINAGLPQFLAERLCTGI